MSATAAELRRPALRISLRRWQAVVLAAALPVALLGAYTATNVSASLTQRSLHNKWDRVRAGGPLDVATLGTRQIPRGHPVARIVIPAVGMDLVAVEGGNGRGAPAHVRGTALPGLPGLTAFRGTRFGFGNQMLNLQRLVPGDTIEMDTLAGPRRFVVGSVAIVAAGSLDLSQDTERPTLLLLGHRRAWGGNDLVAVRAEDVSGGNP